MEHGRHSLQQTCVWRLSVPKGHGDAEERHSSSFPPQFNSEGNLEEMSKRVAQCEAGSNDDHNNDVDEGVER